MPPSYAVLWQEADGLPCFGRLELGRDRLRLEGAGRQAGASMTIELLYREIAAVRVGRAARDRLDGRAPVIVESGAGHVLLVTSTTGLGTNREIEEQLSALAAQTGAR
jgi:hypothetical protein